ncbi:MAG TPA: cysteine desulfurase family protein [bacterium]|jgi:cysteine desulfurase|nr:cysteine desulfurase family protein [bacterium]
MIYFDHAASTPLDEKALEAMMPYLKEDFGNPSSVHGPGREARNAIERAREKIADTLNADPREIIFTSGGTESVNAVHKGVTWAFHGKARHIIISSVEHHCVLECSEWLTNQGIAVSEIPVNSEGWIDPKEVQKAIRQGETGLISIMAANNEVGTMQPFQEIGQMARQQGILFHTDAVQGYGKIPIDVQRDHIDFLSVSGHKIYGPKGTGFIYQRRGLEMVPLVHGGGQERDRRGGTENVAGIVGLGEAARKICGETAERARLRALTDLLLGDLRKRFPDLKVNGPEKADQRVPGLLNISLPGIEGESLVHSLDAKGFAVSSGAACAAGSAPPSHVLIAMGRSAKEAKQGLRFSFGHSNNEGQVKQLAETLPSVIESLQMMSSFLEDDEKPVKK